MCNTVCEEIDWLDQHSSIIKVPALMKAHLYSRKSQTRRQLCCRKFAFCLISNLRTCKTILHILYVCLTVWFLSIKRSVRMLSISSGKIVALNFELNLVSILFSVWCLVFVISYLNNHSFRFDTNVLWNFVPFYPNYCIPLVIFILINNNALIEFFLI